MKEGIAGGIALCSAQLITDLLMKVCVCKLGDTGREAPKLNGLLHGHHVHCCGLSAPVLGARSVITEP